MVDVGALVAGLPVGLCGVVFRHDGIADREALGRRLAKICRARRNVLVVAGDPKLAARLRAGLHLRGGRGRGKGGLVTSSAHNLMELSRARRAGARIIFCSPVFATSSHPGARGLGALGFARLARHAGGAKAYALGGVDGVTIRRLGKDCAGAGAIDAFLCSAAKACYGVISP